MNSTTYTLRSLPSLRSTSLAEWSEVLANKHCPSLDKHMLVTGAMGQVFEYDDLYLMVVIFLVISFFLFLFLIKTISTTKIILILLLILTMVFNNHNNKNNLNNKQKQRYQ